MRYALHLSYFGKNFAGWQKQKNARSIQEEIEKSISTLLKQKIEIVGCGRTDTGVHALNYYAHFNFESNLPDDFLYHANAILDNNIVLHSAFIVDDDWHARFTAKSRAYRYFISLDENPFLQEMTWQPPYKLNVGSMNKASNILLNHDDFTSFARLHGGQKSNICKIQSVDFIVRNNVLIFEIKADRFLRNMVRAIVGTLVDVGRGYCSIEEFEAIIQTKDRSAAGASAPPHGLFLTSVAYDPALDEMHIKNVEDFPYL